MSKPSSHSSLGRVATATSVIAALRRGASLLMALGALALLPALADRSDRAQPLTIEADRPGSVDLAKQVAVFNGNVVITQGTMVIRAERVEVREGSDGFRSANAIGGGGRQATFRQRRDGAGDEFIDGRADRIEYDGRGNTVRFIGNARVQRLRGSTVADEITGALMTYNGLSEVFEVAGATSTAASAAGSAASAPTGGSGRVRVVLTPREGSAAAAAGKAPEAAASAAAAASGASR